MRVLMFGWEFPPHNSGGLGVACKGIVQGLQQAGVDVTFVLPQKMNTAGALKRVRFADTRHELTTETARLYNPYLALDRYRATLKMVSGGGTFMGSLLEQVLWYAGQARRIAKEEPHDVIHCHDWLTALAGVEAKAVSGKPLVLHIHATEFDRTGGGDPNPDVFAIEKACMEAADVVVAVSGYTKRLISEHYGIGLEKIAVVHNVLEPPGNETGGRDLLADLKKAGKKLILFVGRLTLQKGPDWFLKAARRVIDHEPRAHVVVAGSGDMEDQMRDLSWQFGMADKVTFMGFLRGADLASVYSSADVFVMPSVSEPFGLTCLEAQSYGLPVIISRQSGVSEVSRHCFKVDFWDYEDTASKILSILRHEALKETFSAEAPKEAHRFGWVDAGGRLRRIYEGLTGQS
jgi:glycosyltransferase involved in cell wall biosynthesis